MCLQAASRAGSESGKSKVTTSRSIRLQRARDTGGQDPLTWGARNQELDALVQGTTPPPAAVMSQQAMPEDGAGLLAASQALETFFHNS
jgi:hypothetical protein